MDRADRHPAAHGNQSWRLVSTRVLDRGGRTHANGDGVGADSRACRGNGSPVKGWCAGDFGARRDAVAGGIGAGSRRTGRGRGGVHAFAARAEPGLGTLGSLASLGGMWNASAVPASRTTLFALVFSVVLLIVVAVGAAVLWRARKALGLLGIAVAAVIIPALLATGPGLTLTTWLITEVPGLGILRDGQKWVALAMPAYAVAGAAAVIAVRERSSQYLAAGLACAALIFTLPDLAWGVGGRMTAVKYPSGWNAVAAHINADPHPVAVLPPETMRQYPWGPSSIPVLDPFPRWIRADTVSSGDLRVDGHDVRGDGTRGRQVEELLRAGARRGN